MALAAEHPDAIFIETMTDIAEARCAVLAAKSVTDLPVFASCTFGLSGRMDISGTEPEVAAVVLEAAGADAVALNCGLGPEQMLPLLARMVSATRLPVIVQPNAGLPTLDDEGHTVFPGTPEEMAAFAAARAPRGRRRRRFVLRLDPGLHRRDRRRRRRQGLRRDRRPRVLGHRARRSARHCSRSAPARPVRVVGERINPTGKKPLAEELRAGSMSIVRSFAAEQQEAGADLLDVNVGAAGVDAVTALPAAILALVGTTDLPLVIDTTDFAALEAALRVYPGRALDQQRQRRVRLDGSGAAARRALRCGRRRARARRQRHPRRR